MIQSEAEKRLLNLKFEIIKQFTTQRRFAERVREPESVVSQVINGKLNIDPKSAARWARVLRSRAEDLFC